MLVKFGFSKSIALLIHFIAMLPVAGYASYHLLYANPLIGVLSLMSGVILVFSTVSVFTDSTNDSYPQLFVLSISLALLATCYYFGMRGLLLMFPLLSAYFYTFSFRNAVVLSCCAAVLCMVAALNVLDVITVARVSLSMALTIFFNVCFVSLLNTQKAAIQREAGEDYLTGVLNRRSFSTWLNRELPRTIEKGQQLALLYIDLDDFKRINDGYGHSVGDELLKQVSARILQTIRAGDRLGNLDESSKLARLAGDEFCLVLTDVSGPKGVETVVQRLVDNLAEGFSIENLKLSVNASMGIAMTGEDGEDFENLLRNADAAMYRAKRDGKQRYQFFNEDIANSINAEKEIERGVQLALDKDEFELVYMPIYRSADLVITSVEVLLRSTCPALEGVDPERYIQVAEESGLIYKIDLLVLERAFAKIASGKNIPALENIVFCINVSARELLNPEIVKNVADLLQKHQINPKLIELEITETSLVASNTKGIEILTKLKALGIALSLDDFGTGYTAFSQLSDYPVDTLKIDRSFVNNIGKKDNVQRSMVDVILTLAELYKLKIVGEGVETENQLRYLQKNRCHFVQGYYLCKPLAWEDFLIKISSPVSDGENLALSSPAP